MSDKKFWKNELFFVFLIFVVSFAAMGVMFSFPKQLKIYMDELYYYDIAKNLHNGNGLTVRMAEYNFQKILYSFIILPTFSISSAVTRLKVIGWINAFVISLGTFPAYGIAKKLFNEKKHILLSLLLWCVLPVKIYGIGFMSEIPAVPLTLLFVYVFICFLSAKGNVKICLTAILLSLLQYLLYFNKEITLYVFVSFVISTLYLAYIHKENRRIYICSVLLYAVFFFVIQFIIKSTVFSGVSGTYQGAVDDTMGVSVLGILISGYHFVWMFSFVAVGIAFLFFTTSVVTFDKMIKEDKVMTIFLASCVILCMGAVALMISRNENANVVQARAHLRYIEPLMYVYIVYAISILERFYDIVKLRWNAVMILGTIFLCVFVGIGFSFWTEHSFADLSSLAVYQVIYDLLHDVGQSALILMFVRMIMAAFFAALLWMVYKDKKHVWGTAFWMLFIFCFINFTVKYVDGYGFYKVDADLISRFEQAEDTTKKLDGNVAFITHTRDSLAERYFDTYYDRDIMLIDTRNYYFDGLLSDGYIDLQTEGLTDDAGNLERIESIDHIDYIIAFENVSLRDVEKIDGFPLEGDGYILYRNIDPSRIGVDCSWREAVTAEELKNLMFVEKSANEYIEGD